MALPTISEEDVREFIPSATEVAPSGRGGQKVVFRVWRDDQCFALKFALLPDNFQPEIADIDETILRARRETRIMEECKSPHIIKPGPIVLGTAVINGQNVLYFSEEFIDGQSLGEFLRQHGTLTVESLVRLGLQMCSAIDELWSLGKIPPAG
jgi:serine/threonine protein kinase